MKKKIREILTLILLSLALTSCMQVTSEYRIFNDASYQNEIQILIPTEFLSDETYDTEVYKEDFLDYLTSDTTKFTEEYITRNDIEYYSLTITQEKTKDLKDNITITIDEENREITFVQDLSLPSEYLVDMDAFNLGDDYKSILKGLGFIFEERIQMPGEILSSNCGTIENDILIIDLIEADTTSIIVRSKLDSSISSLFIIFIILLTLLITAIVIFINKRKKHKKKLDNEKGEFNETRLEDDVKNEVLESLALEEDKDKNEILESLALEDKDQM